MRQRAPRCRWVLGNLTVDIMPTDGGFLGLNTTWFKEALETASELEFAHTRLRLVSPVAFLATKCVAFSDRGGNDYYASHDLEDFVTVVDGRANIVAEIDRAPSKLRGYVAGTTRSLVAAPVFIEALTGYLPPDQASQRRLTVLQEKYRSPGDLDSCVIQRWRPLRCWPD
jgi:hypothetical protein